MYVHQMPLLQIINRTSTSTRICNEPFDWFINTNRKQNPIDLLHWEINVLKSTVGVTSHVASHVVPLGPKTMFI